MEPEPPQLVSAIGRLWRQHHNARATKTERCPSRFTCGTGGVVALVVFLRGVNVGGHRTFRPTLLAAQLQHLGAVNIGAAGRFSSGSRSVRRSCARNWRAACHSTPASPFVVAARSSSWRRATPSPHTRPGPTSFVSSACCHDGRGRCRTPDDALCRPTMAGEGAGVRRPFRPRRPSPAMKVIGCLGALDRVFGMPLTTRNWNTIAAIATRLA